MAIRGKLQTQDIIMAWNDDTGMKCPLCKKVNNSHNQLFSESEFSKNIWEKLKEKMENRWLSNNSIGSVLMRIVLANVVYYI